MQRATPQLLLRLRFLVADEHGSECRRKSCFRCKPLCGILSLFPNRLGPLEAIHHDIWGIHLPRVKGAVAVVPSERAVVTADFARALYLASNDTVSSVLEKWKHGNDGRSAAH